MIHDYMDEGEALSTIISNYNLESDLAYEIVVDWAEKDHRVRAFYERQSTGAFSADYYLEEEMKEKLLKYMDAGGFDAII